MIGPGAYLGRKFDEPPRRLTDVELLELFGRSANDGRWIGQANSQEYLALVTWLVQRNTGEK